MYIYHWIYFLIFVFVIMCALYVLLTHTKQTIITLIKSHSEDLGLRKVKIFKCLHYLKKNLKIIFHCLVQTNRTCSWELWKSDCLRGKPHDRMLTCHPTGWFPTQSKNKIKIEHSLWNCWEEHISVVVLLVLFEMMTLSTVLEVGKGDFTNNSIRVS